MKTLSVKQVAEVLGISPRAIHKRLASGSLKGTRRENKFGVEEWWVYPNKEIRAALESAGRIDILGITGQEHGTDAESTEELDSVEVIATDVDESRTPEAQKPSETTTPGWSGERGGLAGQLADDLWSNLIARFMEKIESKDQLIGEMRLEIADKDRRLKLLPDLQKQSEEERKHAELKALEAEALRKQVVALQEQQEGAEKAQVRVEELEQELKTLQVERDRETDLIKGQLTELSRKLEAQKPWWKKMFGTGSDAKAT